MSDPIIRVDEGFALTVQERNSALWRRMEMHFTERLAVLRTQNDKPQSEMQTAQLRGHIACLKAVIRLGEDQPPTDGTVPATALPRTG
jgi:hypothetical protein